MKRTVIPAAAGAILVALCTNTSGFDPNPLIADLPDTTWHMLTGTWHDDPNTRSITDYSGMVYDHHRHKILIFGHGHASYGGNEVMEFDIDAAAWDTLYTYTPCSQYAEEFCVYDDDGNRCGGIYDLEGDPMPSSRHTYDGVVMAADTCLMILTCSPFGGSGGNSCEESKTHDEWTGRALWLFDPVTTIWSHTKGNMGIGANPAGVALDPETNDIYMLLGSGQEFAVADYANETRTVLNTGDSPNWEGSHVMNYYPSNRSLLFFGESNIWEWFIDEPERTWTLRNPSGQHVDVYGRQVCFDSFNNVFGVFRDGAFNYYSYATNTWYRIPYNNETGPTNIEFMHTIYDPVNNVYIVINKPAYHTLQTWAYKLGNTPGVFPGTSAGSGVRHAGNRTGRQGALELHTYRSGTGIRCKVTGTLSFPDDQLVDFRIFSASGRLLDQRLCTGQSLRKGVVVDGRDVGCGMYVVSFYVGGQTLRSRICLPF